MRNRYLYGRIAVGLLALAVGAAALASRAAAQVKSAPTGEEANVRAAALDYLQSLHRGDAARLRALWTADGDYVDAQGKKYKAQDLIAQFEATGATDPAAAAEAAKIKPPASTLRFVEPGLAIEDGVIGPPAPDSESSGGRFTAVWVKRNGRWQLDALRETAAPSAPVADESNPKLQPLAWLVGEWAGHANDADVLMSWHWSDGGAYLVGEFAIYRDGQPMAGGSQRVGWDPVAGQIKSWIFDSQGGSGEGQWRADGQHWTVDSKHVTADGEQAKASTTYTPDADGSFVWETAGDWQAAKSPAAKLPAQRIEFHRAAGE